MLKKNVKKSSKKLKKKNPKNLVNVSSKLNFLVD